MTVPVLASLPDAAARCKLLPLTLYLALPVLTVRAAFVHVAPDAAHLWPAGMLGDLNSWWKAALAIGCAALMTVMTAARLAGRWKPTNLRWAALPAAAAITTIVSAIGSAYPHTAWLGYTTLYEGTLVLISYCLAAWYASEMTEKAAERLFLLRLVGAICIIEGIHGTAEYFGWHLWRTEFGRWLMGAGSNVIFYRFADTNMAYGTVFQPNHYGMLMAMLGSLSLGMISRDVGKCWRLFWGAAYLAAVSGVFCSNSRAGIMTLLAITLLYAATAIVAALRNRKSEKPSGRRGPAIFVLIAAVGLLASVLSPGGAARRFIDRVATMSSGPAASPVVKAVGLSENRLSLRLAEKTLYLRKTSSQTWLVEMDGNKETITGAGTDWLTAPVPGAPGVRLRFRPQGNVRLELPDVSIPLYAVGDRLWWYDAPGGRLRWEVTPSSYTVSGWEKFVNERGYIWIRAIETWRRHPLFGTGPGTFAQAFPNDDLLYRERFSQGGNESKGHGVWATFLVQTGIVGLVFMCLPVLYAAYRLAATRSPLRAPLLMALTAYGVCALTNDSTVGVTPIFSVLVGLAVSAAVSDGGEMRFGGICKSGRNQVSGADLQPGDRRNAGEDT